MVSTDQNGFIVFIKNMGFVPSECIYIYVCVHAFTLTSVCGYVICRENRAGGKASFIFSERNVELIL